MRDIKAMLPEEIAAALAEMGQPKYRAKQIFQWLARGVTSFDEMTNLSKDLRAALSERFFISKLEMLRKQVSAIDGTIKYLWQLGDGNAVETVVMHYKHGNTVCISSQVGCRQGCAFCASTIGGLIRNLCLLYTSDAIPSGSPAARSPTSSSWASASRSITLTMSCAFLRWSTTRTGKTSACATFRCPRAASSSALTIWRRATCS